jgi:hypothetical protein
MFLNIKVYILKAVYSEGIIGKYIIFLKVADLQLWR